MFLVFGSVIDETGCDFVVFFNHVIVDGVFVLVVLDGSFLHLIDLADLAMLAVA